MSVLDVTLVVCTCKRLDYFRRTIASLRANLLDLSAVAHRWIIDDNSSSQDRLRMSAESPDFEFTFKEPENAGHGRSLNLLLRNVPTTYALYWEDDSVLRTSGQWLRQAVELLSADEGLLSVSFDRSIENDRRCRRRRDWARRHRRS